MTSGKSSCSRRGDRGLGSEVPLGSVLAQQGAFESGEVMAEVILVGEATVSGRALWGGFKKERRGVKALMKVYN